MSKRENWYIITMVVFAMGVFIALGCTSSKNPISSNPSYNQNFSSQTRSPGKYGNPQGQYESEKETKVELPVTIMQLSFEIGELEVNEPYNIYALVDNPEGKDIRYEWRVTSGKLFPALEEDVERLTELTASAESLGTQPVRESEPGEETPMPPGAKDKLIDGQIIPKTVNPDEALKDSEKRKEAPAGEGEFVEGEPVPPPQIQGSSERGRTEPVPSGDEVARNSGGARFIASHNLYDNPFVRQAVLSMVESEDDSTQPVEPPPAEEVSADATDEITPAEPEDDSREDANVSDVVTPESDADEGAAPPADAEVVEVEDAGESVDTEGTEEVEPVAESNEFPPVDEPSDAKPLSTLDRESSTGKSGGGMPSWPTPWEILGDGERDAGTKLIEDIQEQIDAAIDERERESVVIKDKATVSLTNDQPFVRWIPDTAENVTISLVVLSDKAVSITEPTILDVSVLTPQPKVEIEYEMPEGGMEPGDTLDITLKVRNIPDYRRSQIGVMFDMNSFDLKDVTVGNLFEGGHDVTLFYAQPDKSSGMVTVAISLDDVIRSVRGSGDAATLTFEARQPLPEDIEDLGFGFTNDSNFYYIHDTAGENQLPAPAGELPPLQSAFVAPPKAPAAETGETGDFESEAPESPVPGTGTPPTQGQAPPMQGPPVGPSYGPRPGFDTSGVPAGGEFAPRSEFPAGDEPLPPGFVSPTGDGNSVPEGELPEELEEPEEPEGEKDPESSDVATLAQPPS